MVPQQPQTLYSFMVPLSVYSVNTVNRVNTVNTVNAVDKEGTPLTDQIRVLEEDKERLNRICRKVAELRNKKSVTYPEVLSFLIDKYEESEK